MQDDTNILNPIETVSCIILCAAAVSLNGSGSSNRGVNNTPEKLIDYSKLKIMMLKI